MKDGFIRVATATPPTLVAHCEFNSQQIILQMREAHRKGVFLLLFPELAITSSTCQDLFYQESLIREAERALLEIVKASEQKELITIVGVPLYHYEALYNCAAVIYKGEILGVVPIQREGFAPFTQKEGTIRLNNKNIPFSPYLLFTSTQLPNFRLAIESGNSTIQKEATVVAKLGATHEIVGSREKRRAQVLSSSEYLQSGYLYANAGSGESTTDFIFAGHSLIAQLGELIEEAPFPFEGLLVGELDIQRVAKEREKTHFSGNIESHQIVINHPLVETKLSKKIEKTPFIPNNSEGLETMVTLQTLGLAKRLTHTKINRVVIGISGGLDSTLALLVAVRTFDYLSLDRKSIIGITMPCFGTSERTKKNSHSLGAILGITFKEIDITKSVLLHFEDIGHDLAKQDITYENAQARKRTQVLMDIANSENALVLGTGDLSELALGWTTYNGDHMSMYALNVSVAKTVIPSLITHIGSDFKNKELSNLLSDILATPVSPELLPTVQETESIIGPYELHDFFLYYMVRWGFSPTKILRLALKAFENSYDKKSIIKWMTLFYNRFFTQQFKRSCLPDGPQVGPVSLSPRQGLKMASDANSSLWLQEIETISSEK